MAWYWTVTLGATERFINAVVPFMSLQSAWWWTFLVTLRAAEWFITSVGSFMSLQMAWYWIFEVPLGANECVFTGANSFMSLQIAWCWGMVYHLCGFFLVQVQNQFMCFVFHVENWTDIQIWSVVLNYDPNIPKLSHAFQKIIIKLNSWLYNSNILIFSYGSILTFRIRDGSLI